MAASAAAGRVVPSNVGTYRRHGLISNALQNCAYGRRFRYVAVGIVAAVTSTIHKVDQLFERYAAALSARDENAVAEMYAVPSLILFSL